MFLPHIAAGQPRSGEADRLNEIADAASRDVSGEGCYSSAIGHSIAFRNGSHLELYELTGVMAVDGTSYQWTAEGKPVRLTGAKLWEIDSGAIAEDLWMPSAWQNGSDQGMGIMPYTSGQRVYTQDINGMREIVSPPLDLWRFELKTALAPLSYATAYLLPYTGGALAVDTAVEFTVHDEIGFRGRAYVASSALQGSRGYAKYYPDANRWEIVSMQPHAQLAYGTATSDYDGDDSSVSVSSVTVAAPVDTALFIDATGSGPGDFNNDGNYAGKSGDVLWARWDDEGEDWDICDAPRRMEEFVTEVHIDTSTMKIEDKKRKVWGHFKDDEDTTYNTLHTGDSC